MVSDVTDDKRNESVLEEYDAEQRTMLQCLPDIVMRFDRAGRHLFVSENVKDVVGFTASDFRRRTHRELGFPESLCVLWEGAIERVFESGKPYETEFSIDGKKGRVFFDWRLVPECDADGRVQTVLSVSRNITEHREAKESYLMLFREMLNGCALHEILFDEQGKPVDYTFISVNPAFERMTGTRNEDVVGKSVREIWPDIEQFWIDVYGKVAVTGEPVFFQQFSGPLGKDFEVSAFRYGQGRFACIFADVTERKRAEEQRLRYEQQLRALATDLAVAENRERQRIAALIHDDISQSLALAKIKLGMLKASVPEEQHQTIADASNLIQQTIEKTRSLVHELRPPVLREFGLSAAIESLIEQIGKEYGLDCEFKSDDPLKGLNEDIESLLYRASRELLLNVIKHSRARTIKVTIERDEESARICVEDDGTGFNNADRRKVAWRNGGFGLFNLQERFDYIGGQCLISSNPGHGTKVIVSAPI